MIVKHAVKSCCGSKSYILDTQNPIQKAFLEQFQTAGYTIPGHFTKAGIFYVERGGFVAFGSFGTTRLTVRFNGKNAEKILAEFEALLDSLTKK